MNFLKLPIFILVLYSILAGCNKDNEAKDHLDKGVEYFKQGDYAKSALELKTSSQSDKNTADTYYYLALLDEKNNQFKAMKENLLKSIELAPQKNEARLKLGKLQLLYKEFDAALIQVGEVLKNVPHDKEALLLKASILIKQNKQDAGLGVINEVLRNNPDYVDAIASKAFVIAMQGGEANLNEALGLIDRALKIDEKNINLHLFRIQLNAKKNDKNAVLSEYKELINIYPDNVELKIALSKIYAQNGQISEAEELLKSVADNSGNIKLKFLLLDFLASISAGKAEAQFQQFVTNNHDKPRMLLSLSNWEIARKNYTVAKKVLNQVVDIEEDTDVALSAKIQLAKIALENSELENAEQIVKDILTVNSNFSDAKILLARILVIKRKYEDAIKQLNEVIWNLPNSEEALLLLGQVSLAMGDQSKADKYFENLLQINPSNSQAVSFAYEKALKKNDTKYAKELLEKGVSLNPNNLVLLEKYVELSIYEKNWNAAKTGIQKIADIQNYLAKDLAVFLNGKVLQAQGDYVKALEIFKGMATQFPDNAEVLLNLSNCYERLNKGADAIRFLTDLADKNPSSIAIGIRLGRLLLKGSQYEKTSSLLSKLLKNNINPELYILLADLNEAQKNSQGVIAAYKEGLKNNPDNVNLTLSLASWYEQHSDYKQAVAEYEDFLAKNPHTDMVTNNLASILIEHYPEKLNNAVQLVKSFKYSDNSYYRDTYAWGLVKQGSLAEAISLLKQIIVSDPNVPIFRYHLGFAHHKNGNNTLATAELSQALELNENKGGFYGKKSAEMLLSEISNRK